MRHTLISLFAGIGGLDLAAHWAGFRTVRFVEKDDYCQKVLSKHWPHVPIDDDVFASHPGSADVICGGFPCQPFSSSGKRLGADDERYLLPEMLRIVDEVKPYAVLFENVPGFPSLNDGIEFKYLLRALAEMGFDAEWGHLRASHFGAPHRRERWFLVAYTGSVRRARRGERIGSKTGFTGHSQSIGPYHSTETEGCSAHFQERQQRQLESRLVGYPDGLPARMDGARWPAGMGFVQHDYEPPRLTASTNDREDRIRVDGNTVVPAVAYPLFQSIATWLDEVKTKEE